MTFIPHQPGNLLNILKILTIKLQILQKNILRFAI